MDSLKPSKLVKMLVDFRIVFIAIAFLMSSFGIWFACSTFPNKGRVFFLIVLGLVICTLLEISKNVREMNPDDSNIYYTTLAVSALCNFYCFFVVNQLYVYRLKSMGGSVKFEQFAKYAPYVILCAISILQVVYFLYIFNFVASIVFVGSSVALLSIALILEVYLCAILIQKVLVMLEYRETTQIKTILKTKMYLLGITLLELSIFFIRIFYFSPDSPEGHLRILGFLIRILIVIDFYGDIISSIRNEDEEHDLMMRNYYSARDSGLAISSPDNQMIMT